MTYDYFFTPFRKTVKLWAIPPLGGKKRFNILNGVAPLVTPRDSPSTSKGAMRLGVFKEFISLIPAASTFSQILCSVMLLMPVTKQLEFFDRNDELKRWRDTLRAPTSSPTFSPTQEALGPISSDGRSLSARFPGATPSATYFQRFEGREAQFRWGVKNERIYPVTELMRQSILAYLQRDILYKQLDYFEVLRDALLGFDGRGSENVAQCVHYLLLRMWNVLCT